MNYYAELSARIGAGGAAGKTIRKSEFDALPLMQQALLMSGKDPPQLVDDPVPAKIAGTDSR